MDTHEPRSVMARALDLWQQITGHDPEATSMTMGDIPVRRAFEELQDALDLDDTEVTPLLMLGHYLDEWISKRNVSIRDLLDDPLPVLTTRDRCAQLRALLEDEELQDARARFVRGLEGAIHRYGAEDREDVRELLNAPNRVAFLRRDALRSMKQLKVYQFLRGSPEAADVNPEYGKYVFQWMNINSLLKVATRMPSGVAMNLIRHPRGYESYFVFSIRKGGNLFVLTDSPDDAHPLQSDMRRRPDRDLDRRAAKNWFPYALLGMKYDAEADRVYLEEKVSTALVPEQSEVHPLQALSRLPAEELVWAAMMLALVVERFWHQGWSAPTLSYTGEMMVEAQALAIAAKSAKLPVRAYEPLGFLPLQREDVATGGRIDSALGKKVDIPHLWMEQRYGAKVPLVALEQLTAPDKAVAFNDRTGESISVDRSELMKLEREQKEMRVLHSFEATSFGTREQLEADRLFLARHNYAKAIDALAQQEFQQRRDEVLSWYLERCHDNAPNFLRWAGHPRLIVDSGYTDNGGFGARYGQKAGTTYDLAYGSAEESGRRVAHVLVERYGMDENTHGVLVGANPMGTWMKAGRYRPTCFLTGAEASWRVVFNPASAAELALLAGCQVEDLPDVLQHWTLFRRYQGNSILQRIDPMAWAAEDPWTRLDLRLHFALSRRAMKQVEKDRVMPNLLGVQLVPPRWDA